MEAAKTQEETQLREMVQSIALALAARTVERSRAAEMSQAQMTDTVDVAGTTWQMSATFYRETMSVRVSGYAKEVSPDAEGVAATEAGPGVVFLNMSEIARMFSGEGPTFDYIVPVAWLMGAKAASDNT